MCNSAIDEGKISRIMNVIDLFAGCGGLSLGFSAYQPFKIVAAYDLWEPAINNYRENFKHPIYKFDLSNVEVAVSHIRQFTPLMLIGGPPCQDFSHAGLRSEGVKADLTVAFAQIIQGVKPLWFVMENVERARNSQAVAVAKEIFGRNGYGLTERILDASYCGVPQKRKRYFCVGLLKAKDNFLGRLLDLSLAKKPMTVREYLGNELKVNYYYRHPRNYSRRGIFSVDEPAPTVRGVNRPVPQGYPGHSNDPVRLSSNVRPLTTYERARIQTFPKEYRWVGSKTQIEQIIGNAVPVNLASFVAERILEYRAIVDAGEKEKSEEQCFQLQLDLEGCKKNIEVV